MYTLHGKNTGNIAQKELTIPTKKNFPKIPTSRHQTTQIPKPTHNTYAKIQSTSMGVLRLETRNPHLPRQLDHKRATDERPQQKKTINTRSKRSIT